MRIVAMHSYKEFPNLTRLFVEIENGVKIPISNDEAELIKDSDFNQREFTLVPAPKAKRGDRVYVLNNRNDKWEEGTLESMQLKFWHNSIYWTYDVKADRFSTARRTALRPIRLNVGDEGINRI
jgi:hypothetical protein